MGSHRKIRRPVYTRRMSVGAFVTGLILIVIGCAPAAIEQPIPSISSTFTTPSPSVTHVATPAPSSTPVAIPSVEAGQIQVPVAEPPSVAPVAPIPVLPAAATPTHLDFPAVGISVATHPMDGTSYILDPPPNGDSYWLNNYGQAGAGAVDTVYIIGHSCYGAGCTSEAFPFNRLSAGVAPGQIITVSTANGAVDYRVTDSFITFKDSTPDEKRGTWDNVPGRLVLIGCYTEDPHGSNVIVFATIVEK